jgi:ADP-heptose:LPS heptosyltransferase
MTRGIVVVERLWRNAIVYPFLRLIFKNPHVSLPIDLGSISSLLILRYDKIGDMIVTLPIFRILKSHNPRLRIGVVASEANADLLRDEKCVDKVFVLWQNPFKLLKEFYLIGKSRPDIVLNFVFNRITSGGLIANLLCRDSVKVGQGPQKYGFYFNVLLSLPRGTIHMFEMLMMYIEQVFGMKVSEEERYLDLPTHPSTDSEVDQYLERHGLKRRSDGRLANGRFYIVFNISAGQDDNRISNEQGLSIARHLADEMKIASVIISSLQDADWRSRIVAEIHSERCFSFPDVGSSSLREVSSLIRGAMAVITPHTSIVHIAAATSTPVCGIFSPLQVNQEWLPFKVKYQFIEAGKGEKVSMIPVPTLKRESRKFLEGIMHDGDLRQSPRAHNDDSAVA